MVFWKVPTFAELWLCFLLVLLGIVSFDPIYKRRAHTRRSIDNRLTSSRPAKIVSEV